MKFDVIKRFGDGVAFTANIECYGGTNYSVQLGLAVKWGLANNANLRNANLRNANLSDADLSDANLWNADLRNANLRNANLWNADLRNANLSDADLRNANLRNADLSDANLRNANLSDADLSDANLWNANLWNAVGLNKYIKCIQIETYSIVYTGDVLQIGCERHYIDDWREFDDARIIQMDGKTALKFWRKYKDWIFQTIELCPANPTKENKI